MEQTVYCQTLQTKHYEKLIFSILIILTIFISCGCTRENEKPNNRLSMISFDFIDRPWWESWPDKGAEVNVKMDISSQFTGDAYLVMTVGKEYYPFTIYTILDQATNEYIATEIVYHPQIYEGFKDSLKINDFHTCSYSLICDNNFVENPVDYPVYFKKISVIKGNNKENFKIVFPRELVSIPGKINVSLGIGRLNNEIKSRFEENFPGQYELSESDIAYQKLYFDTFPDSSKTSLVFSNFNLLYEVSFFKKENMPQGYGTSNFFSHRFSLNWYSGALQLWYEEYIYK